MGMNAAIIISYNLGKITAVYINIKVLVPLTQLKHIVNIYAIWPLDIHSFIVRELTYLKSPLLAFLSQLT